MAQSVPIAAQLGPAYTGGVHYRILNGDGTEYVTWTNTNVTEIGTTGTYFVASFVSAPDAGGFVEWSADSGSTVLDAIGTIEPVVTPLDAAGVRSAVGLASANMDTQLSTIDGVVDAILVDTGTDIPALISALNNVSAAQIVTALKISIMSGTKTYEELLNDLWAVVVGDSVADNGDDPTSVTYDAADGSLQRTHAVTDTTRTVS